MDKFFCLGKIPSRFTLTLSSLLPLYLPCGCISVCVCVVVKWHFKVHFKVIRLWMFCKYWIREGKSISSTACVCVSVWQCSVTLNVSVCDFCHTWPYRVWVHKWMDFHYLFYYFTQGKSLPSDAWMSHENSFRMPSRNLSCLFGFFPKFEQFSLFCWGAISL